MKHRLFCKNKNHQYGFTLIELILFMGLFSVILVVLTSLFAEIAQKQLEIQSMSAVESDRSYLLARLEYDIARANAIVTPSAIGESSAYLELDIGGVSYLYQVNGGVLELDVGGERKALTHTKTAITGSEFRRIGNTGGTHTLAVTLTIQSLVKEASGQKEAHINTVFGLR